MLYVLIVRMVHLFFVLLYQKFYCQFFLAAYLPIVEIALLAILFSFLQVDKLITCSDSQKLSQITIDNLDEFEKV